MVQGHQKWYSGLSNTQIHKYKYANTQIQHVRKCRKYPTYLYFWKANDTRTSKMIFWTVKYTNTKTQMHKYTDEVPGVNFQKAKDPSISKMIFWTVKSTNTHEMRLLRITKSETMNHWLTDWLLHCNTRFIYDKDSDQPFKWVAKHHRKSDA